MSAIRWPPRPLQVLLPVGLLLVAGWSSVVAWNYYRPATDEEKRIVGTWRVSHPGSEIDFELTEARTLVTAGALQSGKWTLEGDVFIYHSGNFLSEMRQVLNAIGSERGVRLTFDDDGNITATPPSGGKAAHWERVQK